MRADEVLLGTVLSEKAVRDAERGMFTLKVHNRASKTEIRAALKAMFDVDAVEVNTTIIRGKLIRRARSGKKGAVDVKRPNLKKAFVTLRQGQTLPFASLSVEKA